LLNSRGSYTPIFAINSPLHDRRRARKSLEKSKRTSVLLLSKLPKASETQLSFVHGLNTPSIFRRFSEPSEKEILSRRLDHPTDCIINGIK